MPHPNQGPAPGARDDLSYNRDDEMKPGRPPRSAYEPERGKGSARNPKTMTDPASGEPLPGAPAPASSDADENDRTDDQ